MKCLDESLLQMFVEGLTQGPEDDIVRAHLMECPHCRLTVTHYKQLMWDLGHLTDPDPLPGALDAMQQRLRREWQRQQKEQKAAAANQKPSLLPSWAGHSVFWPRHVPAVRSVGSFLSRASTRLLESKLPRGKSKRGTGGGRR